MSCCYTFARTHFAHAADCDYDSQRALDALRARLTDTQEGIGTVRFHRLDGETVTLKDVAFDSISNVATNRGDLSGDFENGDPFHVPFVAWWEVIYED